jgi:hypothetical protein
MSGRNLSVKYYKGKENVVRYLNNQTTTVSDDFIYVKKYLLSLLNENGISDSISNVTCDFGILILGNNDFCLPVTFSKPLGFNEFKSIIFPCFNAYRCNVNSNKNASYVSSPLMQYAGYATNDLYKLKLSYIPYIIVRFILSCLIIFFCITSLDRVCYVNNFLLSTNLYPDFCQCYSVNELESILRKILQLLTRFHPERIILFRSIDEFGTAKILKNILMKDPFNMSFVLSRKIHYQQVSKSKMWKKSR